MCRALFLYPCHNGSISVSYLVALRNPTNLKKGCSNPSSSVSRASVFRPFPLIFSMVKGTPERKRANYCGSAERNKSKGTAEAPLASGAFRRPLFDMSACRARLIWRCDQVTLLRNSLATALSASSVCSPWMFYLICKRAAEWSVHSLCDLGLKQHRTQVPGIFKYFITCYHIVVGVGIVKLFFHPQVRCVCSNCACSSPRSRTRLGWTFSW